jgi:hypothetical protein
VVLKDDVLFGRTKRRGDIFAFFLSKDNSAEPFVHGKIVEETAVVYTSGVNPYVFGSVVASLDPSKKNWGSLLAKQI